MAKYNSLAAKFDFVLCEGIELEGATASFDFDLNVDISNNLGCPLMLVAGAKNKTVEELVRSIKVYSESLAERSCDLASTRSSVSGSASPNGSTFVAFISMLWPLAGDSVRTPVTRTALPMLRRRTSAS